MGSVVAEVETDDGDVVGRRPRLATLFGVAAVVVGIDQLTKWWALEALTEPTRIIDLVWTLRLRVIYNTGTAFSLTDGTGPIVSVVAVVVVAYLVRSGRRVDSVPVLVGYGLIVGGTVGNILDRAFREGDGMMGGPVIDFVDLQWFPVFNVADAALVIGIAFVLLLGLTTDALDDA